MHMPQYTEHLMPFHGAGNAPNGGRRRWLPVVLTGAALAVAATVAHPVTPLGEADWLTRLADSGDTGAQLELGLAYRDGRDGLAADPGTALYWLKRAARGGNAYAADQLANAYADGDGTAADPALARHWWQAAARAGNADARQHLGAERPGALETVLSVLTGKVRSEQTHAALLSRAKHGDASAQYQVAIRYRDGAAGFPRDAAKSADWMRRAAASGNALAREALAGNRTLAQGF
jgi:hypothetical protein